MYVAGVLQPVNSIINISGAIHRILHHPVVRVREGLHGLFAEREIELEAKTQKPDHRSNDNRASYHFGQSLKWLNGSKQDPHALKVSPSMKINARARNGFFPLIPCTIT